jgi:hypothetical protein
VTHTCANLVLLFSSYAFLGELDQSYVLDTGDADYEFTLGEAVVAVVPQSQTRLSRPDSAAISRPTSARPGSAARSSRTVTPRLEIGGQTPEEILNDLNKELNGVDGDDFESYNEDEFEEL